MSLNILVTGANGFLGSALMRRLSANPHIEARGSVRSNKAGKPNMIAVGDIGLDTDWSPALCNVDVVVHTAAKVHIMRPDSSALQDYRRVNAEGTRELARQAAAAGVKRLVFVSSIKVNGERTAPGHPFRAEDDANPLDDYGVSKLEAEEALRSICSMSALEYVIIRPPLIYGAGAAGNFASLIEWTKKGIPLPLGAVRNKRSFVSLGNICDLICVCLTHPNAAGETFLVSDGEPLSTAELINRLAIASGRSSRLVAVPVPLLRLVAALVGKGAMAQRLLGSLEVDIDKTRRLLNWEPPISLDEGFRDAVSASSATRSV